MENGTTKMPPIEYPTVTIKGVIYALKYTLLAEYTLDSFGVDTSRLMQVLSAQGGGKVGLMMKLFAACVAHHFIDAGTPAPTPDQWAATLNALPDGGKEAWVAICKAIPPALLKVPPPALKLQEPAASSAGAN